jgi:hypothetical protein
MVYRIEVFIQGHGWLGLDIVVSDFWEALDVGASTVINDYLKNPDRHGSKAGDVVGFRIVETNAQPTPTRVQSIKWSEVSHRFFKRGNAYFLYKTWSWPD